MKLIQTPTLRNVKTYSATDSYDFKFDYRGSVQIVKNNLVIENTSNNIEIYNKTIDSFSLQHTVISNSFLNGQEYKAKIRVGDINNNWSDYSDWIVFNCYSHPTLVITSINNGIINNQNPLIQATYQQAENDLLNSYRFLLYDNLDNLLYSYPEKFDKLLQQQIEDLQNNNTYKIELKTLSENGMEYSSGLIPFVASYIEPKLASVINLSNLKDSASVEIVCHLIQIIGKVGSGSISYENDEWVNLLDGMVYFQDGFYIEDNFTLKLWCKQLPLNDVFLRLKGKQGEIYLKYQDNRIYLYKTIGTNVYYYIFSDEILPSNNDTVFISIQQKDNYCNIFAKVVI